MPKTLPEFSPADHTKLDHLYQQIDQAVAAAVARYPEIQCTSGCSHCCYTSGSPLVVALEWQRIRQHWPELSHEVRQQILEHYAELKAELKKRLHAGCESLNQALYQVRCVFLIDEKCSIYTHRPLTCRAYGIAKQDHSEAPVWQGVFACNMEKDRWETVLRQHEDPPEPDLPVREDYYEKLSQIDPTPMLTLLSYFDWEMRHAPLTD